MNFWEPETARKLAAPAATKSNAPEAAITNRFHERPVAAVELCPSTFAVSIRERADDIVESLL